MSYHERCETLKMKILRLLSDISNIEWKHFLRQLYFNGPLEKQIIMQFV